MTPALIVAGLAILFGFYGLYLWKTKQDQSTGAALEAGKVNAEAVKAETAIAQAAVSAPTTKADVVDELQAGKF